MTRSVSRLLANRLAIGRLLVTICSGRPTSSRATSSVVVPPSSRMASPSWMRAAAARAMALLLVQLAGRAFFQGRQSRGVADVDGPAVRAPDRALLVPVIQVAAKGRFGDLDRFGQVGQGDKAAC